MLGLDQVEAINVGAAPTPVEVLEFFHAIGLPLSELWGMSETCGAGAVNPPGKIKIGTVGPPAPGVEIKLDTDGEVLIKSEVVMLGYRNLPEKTAEAFTEDGWLRTGDIGAIDEDGYLTIVDRKKELIISAAGKNMSPANIEATLKSASPLIGQACCIGDARPLQHGADRARRRLRAGLGRIARASRTPRSRRSPGTSRSSRRSRRPSTPPTSSWRASNRSRSSRSSRATGCPAGDELTPTMKLKRKPIAEKYTPAIDAMYAD